MQLKTLLMRWSRQESSRHHSFFARASALLISSLLAGQILTGVAEAQVGPDQRDWLAEQLEAAKADLDPAALPDVADSQEKLLQQVEATRQFFQRITTPGNAEAWMQYVQAAPLVEAIRSDADLAEQSRLAEDLRHRLSRNIDGLDLAGIVELREAAGRFVAAIRFREKDRSIELLRRQLDSLAQRLRDLEGVPSGDESAAISAILGLLAEAGQAVPATQHLRMTFGQPNLTIQVGESLVSRVVGQPVLRTRDVRECILGTRLVGQATLDGQVSGRLLPSEGSARIQLALDAAFQSCNTGYNGPVSLRTVGNGFVHASRTLVFDDQGPRLEPTSGTASLNTQILSINHHLRLVRKIAAKRAAQQKPLSERIATEKLRNQVTGEFARETDELVNRPMDVPLDEARQTFQRLGISPPQRAWRSTSDYIEVDVRQAEPAQILASNSPPQMAPGYAMVVQLHESVIDNIGSAVLAGRTMNESEIEDLLENVRPEPAGTSETDGDEANADGEVDPFEIDFANLRPLILEARDQTLRIGLRGTRFRQGDRELQRAMEISALYQPTTDASGKVSLERTGEVSVAFPGRGRLSISQVAIKSNIQRAFADIFPPQILDRPIQLPLERAGDVTLQPAAILAADAWLSVALQQE